MRIFGLSHPDQARPLPAHFADWALRFDLVEKAAESDRIAEMWGS